MVGTETKVSVRGTIGLNDLKQIVVSVLRQRILGLKRLRLNRLLDALENLAGTLII